jgi:3-phosphoshikimate 1-carboxyvinyltransferase
VSSIEIRTCGPVAASLRPPGSKSLTNRSLICSALASGKSELLGALDSEDTRVMVNALQQLGIPLSADFDSGRIVVEGLGGLVPASTAALDLRNSGTSIRFLTALCTLGHGRFVLDGIERMRQRPIGDLEKALNQLGGDVRSRDGFPPVEVHGKGLRGGTARIRCSDSSQFLSAMMLVLPCAREFTVLKTEGELVSQPFVTMTASVMRAFGVDVMQLPDIGEYSVDPRHQYFASRYSIEPDASAASYFWAAAAITGGTVTVQGLDENSVQGDIRFVRLLEEMGCDVDFDPQGVTVSGFARYGIEADLNDVPDTAQSLAVVAAFAEGPTTIRGIAHNRLKETDRIANLATELRKLGSHVEVLPDGLHIDPRGTRPATIETWNDHRMAMAFSIAGLRQAGVVILNPECVAKTFPGFFHYLKRLAGDDGKVNGKPVTG